jgi:hypothetical protein
MSNSLVFIGNYHTTAEGEGFIAIGMDRIWRLLVVVYTERGNRIRLISARPITPAAFEDLSTSLGAPPPLDIPPSFLSVLAFDLYPISAQ